MSMTCDVYMGVVVVHDGPCFWRTCGSLSLKDDEGLTRPGAKRVRLWRDRGGPGGVPDRTRVKRLLPFVPQGSKNLL